MLHQYFVIYIPVFRTQISYLVHSISRYEHGDLEPRTALRLPIITQPRTTNLASLPVPTCPHDPRLLTDPRSPSQAPFIYELSAGGANLTDDIGKKP